MTLSYSRMFPARIKGKSSYNQFITTKTVPRDIGNWLKGTWRDAESEDLNFLFNYFSSLVRETLGNRLKDGLKILNHRNIFKCA